jgi:hypothetical protein
MVKITNDDQAISLIDKLLIYDFKSEEESSEILVSLEDYQAGIADIITTQKKLPSSFEILKSARKKNRPILL